MDVLRPFLLVALLAFTVGFVGYFALARPVSTGEAWGVTTSAPAADPANPARAA